MLKLLEVDKSISMIRDKEGILRNEIIRLSHKNTEIKNPQL